MICYPPNYSSHTAAVSNSKHDFLSLQDVSHFIEALPVVINVRGRELWHCSTAVQHMV